MFGLHEINRTMPSQSSSAGLASGFLRSADAGGAVPCLEYCAAGGRLRKNIGFVCVCAFVLAIATAVVVTASQGPLDRHMGGDGLYYIELAHAMASGKGYMLDAYTGDPWHDRSHLSSLPLWPVLLTPAEWLFPHANRFRVLRSTGIFFHGIAASLLALLTYRIWRDSPAAFLAG